MPTSQKPAEIGWWSEVWRSLVALGWWWKSVGLVEPAAMIACCAAAHQIQTVGLDELDAATAAATAAIKERGRHMTRAELLETVAAQLSPAVIGGRITA